MLASNAVAVSFAEKIIGNYAWVISIFVALSTFGFLNSVLLSSSRIIFAAARNNHMPSILAFINIRFRTPIVSVIFMSGASLICLLVPYTFVLLRINVLGQYLFMLQSVLGLLYLRKTQPKAPRPIKVSLFYPYSFLIICLFIIVLSFYQKPIESFFCIGIIALGIPIYWVGVRWPKPKPIQKKLGK
jgi:amino acid transporter